MFLIKSNKLLILVTTLCIMVTNDSKASNAIEVLDSNNIEHNSSVIEKNMESVVIDNTHNISESHNNNELNNNNLEHNNGEINHSDNNLEHSNSEANHDSVNLENGANLNHSDNNINHEDINNEHNNNSNSINENAEQNNNNDVVLEVKEEDVKEIDRESMCISVTKLFKGVITIPILLGSYAISTSNFDVKNDDSSSNIAINDLQNGSKEVFWKSFGNTVKEFQNTTSKIWGHITNLGSSIITFCENIKSYFSRRMFG